MGVHILLDDGSGGSVLVRRTVTDRSTEFKARMFSAYEAVIVRTTDIETSVNYPLLEG